MSKNIIKNRYEFMVLVEAVMCNPNGDPDMGNLPRQDMDTSLGIITDVAIKRRIRNYVQDAEKGYEILMKSGINLTKVTAEAVMAATGKNNLEGVKKGENIKQSQSWLCEKYWDARTFGGVMVTGHNAGQIRGAVQMGMATSIDPITVEDMTITRMCFADKKAFDTLDEFDEYEAKMDEDKKRKMGNKKVIPYGLYIIKGSISASLAEKNGFLEEDLDMLWEAILQMYNHDISSSKTGMNVVSPLIIFKHVGTQHENNAQENAREAKLGCAPAHMLYNLLSVKRKENIEYPRKYEDYEISFKASGIPNGVEVGFKYLPFSAIEWNTDGLQNAGINIV